MATDGTISQAAKQVILLAIEQDIQTKEELIKIKNHICGQHRLNSFRDAELIVALDHLEQTHDVQASDRLKKLLIKRRVRTLSGIAPISVLTKPWPCRGRCTYCPTEVMSGGKTLMQIDLENKGQVSKIADHYHEGDLVMPKSYISSEPGAMRALQADFDPFLQISRRLKALHKIGHTPEKCELIIQGGTFADLPEEYRISFVTRCYQAFNDPFGEAPEWNTESQKGTQEKSQNSSPLPRGEGQGEGFPEDNPLTLSPSSQKKGEDRRGNRSAPTPDQRLADLYDQLHQAQKLNESADHRVIGLTVETRPDALPPEEILLFRRLGVTRVEMGVQTLDEHINDLTKRGHDVDCVREATHKLRAAGFKVVYHMMPMLPGSNPQIDLESYQGIWEDADFRPDYIKIYPTSVVPFSELHEIHARGEYQPYDEQTLFDLLQKHVELTPPYVRISRLVRDIPGTAIVAGSRITNLRQLLEIEMAKNNQRSMDIRAREIKDDIFDPNQARLKVRSYRANYGQECFLEFQLPDETLLALLRLRLPDDNEYVYDDAIKNCAMIRELHTYGVLQSIQDADKKDKPQHRGLGKRLLEHAEQIARTTGYTKLAVISGVGVKEYYRKLGFVDAGTYLIKDISKE